MALDTKGRAAGLKDILRRLRGEAPRPLQPEDQIEGMVEGKPEEVSPQIPEEDEEVLESASPLKKRAPPILPRIGR